MRKVTDIVEPVDDGRFVDESGVDVLATVSDSQNVRSVLSNGYGNTEQVPAPDDGYVTATRFDPDHGILALADPQYSGEYGRKLFTMLFTAADDAHAYQGVLAVDQHGAGGILYDDGNGVDNGVDQSLMTYIQDIAFDYWLDDGVAHDDGQPPYDDVFRVELEGRAAEYWEKADGTRRDPMNTTLRKLASDPYQGAETCLSGGREVMHRFDGSERLVAEIDEEERRVAVKAAGHYEDIMPFKQA